MSLALAMAARAFNSNEVPVGAILVEDGLVVGEGWNQPIGTHDASAHAEIMALRDASKKRENYRLPNSTLYVTIEPCAMCVGAIVHARIGRVVYGALEPKAGCVTSQLSLFDADHWNHKVEVTGGVLDEEASTLMKDFFKMRREQKKKQK